LARTRFGAALGALLMVTAPAPARAHEWYPWECCSALDCAPVVAVTVAPDAGLIVTSRHGTVVVPAGLQRRESQDARMHVCMRPDAAGQMQPICLFVPPGM